jgi:hypothetical protein
MTTTTETERQREEIVRSMVKVLGRLAASRDWLNLEQRFFVAECLRDIADHLDRGRVLSPQPRAAVPCLPLSRLVPTSRRDPNDGRVLYKIF